MAPLYCLLLFTVVYVARCTLVAESFCVRLTLLYCLLMYIAVKTVYTCFWTHLEDCGKQLFCLCSCLRWFCSGDKPLCLFTICNTYVCMSVWSAIFMYVLLYAASLITETRNLFEIISKECGWRLKFLQWPRWSARNTWFMFDKHKMCSSPAPVRRTWQAFRFKKQRHS